MHKALPLTMAATIYLNSCRNHSAQSSLDASAPRAAGTHADLTAHINAVVAREKFPNPLYELQIVVSRFLLAHIGGFNRPLL